jgi:thiol-disulfide isomerase/thioredoxin/ribosomal protein L23
MKKSLIPIFTLFTIIAYSQKSESQSINQPIPQEAFEYVNSIRKNWRTEKYDIAIDQANKLVELYPPFLVDKVHNQLIIDIDNNKKGASDFLTKLYNTKNEKINKIIEPAYLWNTLRHTQYKDSLLLLFNQLNIDLKRNILKESKPELYCLKVLNDPDKKQIIKKEQKEKILLFIVAKSSEKLNIDDAINDKNRAYIRSILAYSYYSLFRLVGGENYLKLASFYSPDKLDRQNKGGYTSSLMFLIGKSNDYGFQQYYIDYLVQNDEKEEALKELTKLTLAEPTNYNVKNLKSLFKDINSSTKFKVHWYSAFSGGADKIPEMNFKTLKGVEINTSDLKGKWTLIDFWATWCRPCISELPEVEKFHKESENKYHGKLSVLTISFNSTDIKAFMDSNGYTFPVIEIDEKGLKELNVKKFPTKMLVSPDGSFRTIPYGFGVNWVEYIDNYTLINKTN